MTTEDQIHHRQQEQVHPFQFQPISPATAPKKKHRSWVLRAVLLALLILILLLSLVVLILALTVFRVKQPSTQLLSATVHGVAPRLTLPAVTIQLNVTLDLSVLVENRNRASFRHGRGQSTLFYRGVQVGEAEIYPGTVPARGSVTLPCRLTLQAERLASDMGSLIRDVVSGELTVEANSVLPGKISLLGIYKKHIVAHSNCQLTVGFPDLKIQRQDCHFKAKF